MYNFFFGGGVEGWLLWLVYQHERKGILTVIIMESMTKVSLCLCAAWS